MKIYTINHKFIYEIENVCRLFFPNEKFVELDNRLLDENDNDNYVYTEIKKENQKFKFEVIAEIDSKIYRDEDLVICELDDKNEMERIISLMVFKILSKITNLKPSWGIVTGVRPVKLFRSLIEEGGDEFALDYFENKLLVSKEKINLTVETNYYEKKIIDKSKFNSFSLYVSIPFCPTRCAYCSFVSQSIEKCANLIPKYVELLVEELKYTAKIASDINLNLETVYIGGGTPTTLNEVQLGLLIDTINTYFDMSTCKEFTIEAGRPDTITEEKLRVMKLGGVTRISINPQTFNDDVLKVIGRKHDSKQTLKAFEIARKCGHNNINMDLIAGLPSDTYESFCMSLTDTINLSPEGITIHTLSLKRASNININNEKIYDPVGADVKKMLDEVSNCLPKYKYHPYYLYRQSRMIGNMENVGWSKDGFDGLYNIYIMDETHTILSCGAGAVTKLKNMKNGKIERVFNYKFAYEYIANFEQIIKRKGRVIEFYEEL